MRVSNPAAVHARTAREVERAVAEVLRGGWWVGGPVLQRAEEALAAAVGTPHAVGTGSGTAALQRTLEALGIGPGDEVVVPAVSFVATGTAVLRTGARPVVVDVLPGLPLIDPTAVQAALSPAVKAVVPVALFGNAAPAIALPDGVHRVCDAAQAMGRTAPLPPAMAYTYSFYPTKVLPASGDAGLVATHDPTLAQRVRSLGLHGRAPDGSFHKVGPTVAGNDRMDAIQAAILQARLPDLAPRVAHRRRLLARYRHHLPQVVLPHDPGSNVAVVAAVHPHRDRLRAGLSERGIHTGCYYPLPLSDEPVLADARVPAPTPRAHDFCTTCFALPCHIGLTEAHVDHICGVLLELLP